MTIEEIKELVQLVIDTGVAELEVARGDQRVRIRRNAKVTAQEVVIPAHAGVAAAHFDNSQPAVPAAAHSSNRAAAGDDESLAYVKSPIVGTFYEAPAPDAPPFVRIGDRVQPGQVLCIIESMKLMNEIEAEVGGTVVRQLVENGRPVEYGETLYAIQAN
ncbi:MAG: acetyl-CoA carboxylase biotin carboxyl carrier protein [Bryobacteraceae bacterium]|nr:acetyl-CoA carboxylase biotin carboxyl carrier protein [Bryobacteraceae bacterium]